MSKQTITTTDIISSMLTTTTTMIAASCSSNTLSSAVTASSAITTTTTATTDDDEVDNWEDDDIDDDKQQQQQQDEEEDSDDDAVFTRQFLQRGEWLRQLRELERQDDELRAKANEGREETLHQHKTDNNENDHDRVQKPLQNDDTNYQSSDNTLRYNSEFLALGPSKQIYDDYKHVNFQFIELDDLPELSFLTGRSSTLTIEQDRTLGKGGFVWDAGFILAQTLIRRHQCTTNTSCSKNSFEKDSTSSNTTVNTSNSSSLKNAKRPFHELPDPFQSPTTTSTNSTSSSLSIVELGSGTGICGLMIAAALSEAHAKPSVTLDPSKQKIHIDNHENYCNQVSNDDDDDDEATVPTTITTTNRHDDGNTSDIDINSSNNNDDDNNISIHLTDLPNLQDLLHRNIGRYYSDRHNNDYGVTVTNGILEWGRTATCSSNMTPTSTSSTYDVILGGDVVAGIYDSTALVESIVDMSHPKTHIYLALRERLTGCIEQFIEKLNQHFDTLEWYQPSSSNYSPNVFILYVTNKR